MAKTDLNGRILLILTTGLLTACHGADYWSDHLQADPLYRRAQTVRESASCSALVPVEFGRTFPIPAHGAEKRFTALYYPLVAAPGKAEVLTPLIETSFARDSAETDRCRRIEKSPPKSLGRAVPAGLSMTAYYRAAARLFPALDRTAALYHGGKTLTSGDKAALADFIDSFQTLAEPPLLAHYYRLNPDFWEWLRRETGRSIPKPPGA